MEMTAEQRAALDRAKKTKTHPYRVWSPGHFKSDPKCEVARHDIIQRKRFGKV